MQPIAVGQLLLMCSGALPPRMTNGRFLVLAFIETQDLIANNQPHADLDCRVENAPQKTDLSPGDLSKSETPMPRHAWGQTPCPAASFNTIPISSSPAAMRPQRQVVNQ